MTAYTHGRGRPTAPAQGESCVHVAATARKSSHCQEGDACVHISAGPETIHLTESADPTQAVLRATSSAFGALLHTLKENRHRS
ncbi:DUF397 domain-containing protein [Streptomyces sp. DSM 40750]|nr:DUF397 domain-containing protein [Streptomyces sp. DSM 40750]UUU23577.1 DUF397 domain-containing protein [Streptomyces sp. DSM 40750]